MSFGSVFDRFSRRGSSTDGASTRTEGSRLHRSASGRGRKRGARGASPIASVEALEDRRLLAFQYVGFSHSDEPTFAKSPQSIQYDFEIYNDSSNPGDSATMYMRNLAIQGQLQFDYGTTFSSLSNGYGGLTYNWGTRLPAPGGNPSTNIVGPVALSNSYSLDATWNNPDPASTTTENFQLAKVRVAARPGTVDPTFILHVGDTMPLALEVDFSQAKGTSTIIIRSDATQGSAGGTSLTWLPHGGGYNLLADKIYIQAAMNVGTGYANDFRSTSLIQIENAVTGTINARVSDGDFKIIAGASVSGGSADIRIGNGVPPSASSPYSAYGFGGNGGNIIIDGTLAAGNLVNLQTTSVDPRSIVTGPQGLISGLGSITLNNAGADGGVINVRTSGFYQHNIFAGTNSGPAADIAINVTQVGGNLTINALPASRATISLAAPDGQVITNSNVDTIGGLALAAQSLNVNRPISTQQGDITLTGSAVTIGSNVSAGTTGIGNLVVTATGGDVRLTSAAVAKATGDAIILKATGNIDSQSRLEAVNLDLSAGGTINALTRTDTVTAKAGRSITLTDDDAIRLTQVATSGDGSITVNAGGLLDAVSVSTAGTGDIVLTTSAVGLLARDLSTTNGSIRLRAQGGDITVVGAVKVNDTGATATQDFVLTADTGNIIMRRSATVNVADQLSVNAPQGRVITPGTVDGVTVTNGGSGYVNAPTVTLSSGSGAVVTPTVGEGKVTFIKITSGGSGYVTAPAVVFANTGTGGSGATATAQLTGGVVTGITITNGGVGYTTAPTISFVGGGGSAATATASINGLTALSVSPTGSGYQVPPTVVISSGTGAATGTVTVDSTGKIQGINVAQMGSGFTAPPTVQIVDSSGTGFGGTAVANLTGGVTGATATTGGTKYGGGTTATVTGGGGSGATGIPLLGLTQGSIGSVTNLGTGYAVGDLLTVVAGSGAQVQVTQVSGSGAVQAVSVTRGGGNYSVGDILYLGDAALGGTGLRLTVSTVTNGGAVTGVTVTSGGSGFSTASTLNHVGGTGAILQVAGDSQVTAITVNDRGTGYTSAPTVTITGVGGVGSGATATAYVSGGRVSYISVTNPGSGYVNGATVTLTGGGSGFFFEPALATVVVQAVPTGALSLVRAGTGYTTRPSAVTGGSGTGMVVSFNDTNYSVVGYRTIQPGSNYTSAPTISLSAPGSGGTTAVLAPNVEQVVGSITVTSPGNGYAPATTAVTLVPVASGGGATAAPISVNGLGGITRINLANPGNGFVVPPTVSIVDRGGSGSGAAATATTALGVTAITLTNSGAGYTSTPTVTIGGVGGAGSGATAVARIANGFLTGITVTNPGSGYVNGATVTISGGGASRQGAATAATSFVVTGITVTSSGSGYAPSTTDVVLTPRGTGATGIANLDPATGAVSSIRITDNGSGYSATNPPTVTLLPFGSGALATSTISGGTVTGVTVTSPGSGYAVPPKVIFSAPPSGTTATGFATIGNVAQLSAKRLDWTALEQPLDALLAQFSVAGITLTGSGDLVINRPTSDLTLEKAVTKDGSVLVTAQRLTLNGPVTAGDYSSTRTQNVTLRATGADLLVNFPVTAPATATLQADAGAIIGSPTGLVTAKDLVVSALNGITLTTKVDTVAGKVSGSGAGITIDEVDDLVVGTSIAQNLSANNGPVNVTAGGVMTVNRVDAGPTGSVTLTAGSNLLQAVVSDAAEVVAGTANLVSKGGRIDLDTNVTSLSASAASSTIDIDNVGTLPLTLQNVTAGNSVRVNATSVMNVKSVTSTANNVTLATVNPVGSVTPLSIFIDTLSATKGVATVTATGDVLSSDPTGTSPNILASTARVSAVTKSDGLVNLRTAVGTLGAQANGAITINELDAVTLGEPTGPAGFQSVKSVTGSVKVTAGGTITATDVQAIAAKQSVQLTSTGGGIQLASILTSPSTGQVTLTAAQSITDTDPTVDITAKNVVLTATGGSIGAVDAPVQLTVDTVTASAKGSIYIANDKALSLTSITGGDVGIKVDGPLTQTGPIVAAALRVTGDGSLITLDTQDNQLGAFGATNLPSAKGPGRVVVKDTAGGLDMLSTNVGSMFVTAAGVVTQSEAIAADKLTVQGTFKDGIFLDTQPNKIGSFAASNGSAPVGIKDADGNLDITFIQGSAVTIVAGGTLTQSGFINATNLAVTGNGSPIILDTQTNSVDGFQATNPGGSVVFKDATGGLVLGKSNVGTMTITAAGPVTQSGAIVADGLTIAGTGFDPITLDTQDNEIGSFAASNYLAPVSVKDTSGDMNIGFIQGGPVTISVAGGLTQSGFINATDLVVNGTGAGTIQLNSQPNKVQSFQASNGIGNIFFANSVGDLVIKGLDGNNLGIVSAGSITQTGPIMAAGLNAVSLTGGVTLANTLNTVALVGGSAVGDFVFTDFPGFKAGPITVTGTNSNIVLRSLSGSIDVVGTLTAPNLVSLSAPNGTFNLVAPATISAAILSYETSAPPTPQPFVPGSVPAIIAVGGNLTIDKPGQAVTFGNFVTSGNITIKAASITVTGPLVTTGAGKSILLEANPGAVDITATGTAEAAGTGSSVTIKSGAGITAAGIVKASLLDLSGTGGAMTLANAKNVIDTLKVDNGNRDVTIANSKGLSISSLTGGNVSLSLGGHLVQTGPLVATAASLTSTFGNMVLTDPGNDVGTLTVDNGTRLVNYSDKNGLVVGGIKAGTLNLSTKGQVTQTGAITATTATVTNATTGTVTLDAADNDFGTLAITNDSRDVTVVDKNAIVLAGVSSGPFALTSGGNVTQTAPINAAAFAVTSTGGTITLADAGNSLPTLKIANATRAASVVAKGPVVLSNITAGAMTLQAGGAVTQTQPATTTSFNVTTTSGGVTMGNTGNKLGTLSAKVSTAGAGLTVANDGQLQIAQVSTQGPVTISTVNAGNVVIGPAATPSAKLQTTGAVNFTGVAGNVVMSNNGTIVAPGGVTMPAGKRIQWSLTSAADSGTGSLRDTIQTINAIKAPSQISYGAPATIKLASALPTVLVPLTVLGNNALTLDGTSAGATASGLAFDAKAAGSSVSGVTFQNFGQAGVWLSGAAGSTVTGITVTNSLYGLLATGALASGATKTVVTSSTFTGNGQGAYLNASGIAFGLAGQGNVITGSPASSSGITMTGVLTGTTVQGNTIRQTPTAFFISAATGAVVGGTGTGLFNYVEYASNGVFATGTCTGTSIVKMAWGPGVTTRYNTSSARGLSIIQ